MTNSYITTPIYYVNDAPHIGHAYTSVVCDALARLKRLNGETVKFLTGTDEHGQKVEKSAIKNGKTPQEFCDEVSLKFRNLAKFLDISNDDFIRTTEDRHKKTAQIFWNKLLENGWIYKDVYEGWYSIRDEAFYGEDELVNGKAPTGAEVEWQKEESYFFKLSAFQDILLEICQIGKAHLSHEGSTTKLRFNDVISPSFRKNDVISPSFKKNEVASFIRGGKELVKGHLKDLSISRTSFKWGIPVPNDENHIMYVWLDALTNYLSALNYPEGQDFKDFWENGNVTHVVGKDILRFHAVYWPAFLIASEFQKEEFDKINEEYQGLYLLNSYSKDPRSEKIKNILPDEIFAHGWWTNEGEKISKSVGNIIDPYKEIEWLESFGISQELAIDYFRYFLNKEIFIGNDGDYSRERFVNRINSELANNIGNLAQRSLSMIFKNNDGFLVYNTSFDKESEELLEKIKELIKDVLECNFKVSDSYSILELIITISSKTNEYFANKAPWNLKKEGKIEEMNNVLYVVAEIVRKIAILLLAFTPKSADKILDLLNISQNERNFANLENPLKFGAKINEPTPIFLRLNHK